MARKTEKKITEEKVICKNCRRQGVIGEYNMCQECEEWFCDHRENTIVQNNFSIQLVLFNKSVLFFKSR